VFLSQKKGVRARARQRTRIRTVVLVSGGSLRCWFSREKRSRFFVSRFTFFQPFSPSFFPLSLRLGRRQLRAGAGGGRHVTVQAERYGLVPFPLLEQRRVEGREQKLGARRHEDAADARRGEAVAREQRVEGALAALQVEAPRQQGPLQVRGRGREELLVLERDLDAVGEREGRRRGDRRAERLLVAQKVGRARRREGVDLRRRDQRPARRLVPRAAGPLVEAPGLARERRVQALLGPVPLARIYEVRETRRRRSDGLRERALRAAAREVGEGGVGDQVDRDLRDLEVEGRIGDLGGVLDRLPKGPDADRAGREVVLLKKFSSFFLFEKST